jgi:hypothetical protein
MVAVPHTIFFLLSQRVAERIFVRMRVHVSVGESCTPRIRKRVL